MAIENYRGADDYDAAIAGWWSLSLIFVLLDWMITDGSGIQVIKRT